MELTCLPGPCWPGGPAPPCRGSPRSPGTRGAPGCGAARHCPWPTGCLCLVLTLPVRTNEKTIILASVARQK